MRINVGNVLSVMYSSDLEPPSTVNNRSSLSLRSPRKDIDDSNVEVEHIFLILPPSDVTEKQWRLLRDLQRLFSDNEPWDCYYVRTSEYELSFSDWEILRRTPVMRDFCRRPDGFSEILMSCACFRLLQSHGIKVYNKSKMESAGYTLIQPEEVQIEIGALAKSRKEELVSFITKSRQALSGGSPRPGLQNGLRFIAPLYLRTTLEWEILQSDIQQSTLFTKRNFVLGLLTLFLSHLKCSDALIDQCIAKDETAWINLADARHGNYEQEAYFLEFLRCLFCFAKRRPPLSGVSESNCHANFDVNILSRSRVFSGWEFDMADVSAWIDRIRELLRHCKMDVVPDIGVFQEQMLHMVLACCSLDHTSTKAPCSMRGSGMSDVITKYMQGGSHGVDLGRQYLKDGCRVILPVDFDPSAYTLIRLSDLRNHEEEDFLTKLEQLGRLHEVASVLELPDESWELVVLRAHVPTLEQKMGQSFASWRILSDYDPMELNIEEMRRSAMMPKMSATREQIYLKAKVLQKNEFVKRARIMVEEGWPIAAEMYQYLLKFYGADTSL